MTNTNQESLLQTAAAERTQIDRRNQRIEDYLAAALESECPSLANVGAANSDLMRVQCFLRQAIDDALTEVTPSLAELAAVMPGIDTLVKIAKQIDRFTQLEIKLKQAVQEAAGSGETRLAASDKIMSPE